MILSGEREFAGFGADANMSVLPGVCHPHAPRPLTTVKRLQTALQGLSRRVGDSRANTDADGLVGPHTVQATNYAIPKYTAAPAPFNSGRLTHGQIVALAPQLAAYAEGGTLHSTAPLPASLGPVYGPPAPSSGPAYLPASTQRAYTPSSGGSSMPYPAQPQYYPPGYAPAPAYPGYAPREASVDIKTFIPAQYEHVKFNPATIALVLGVGVITVMVMNKKAQYKKIA